MMDELREYPLWLVFARLVGLVLLYYTGTRGVLVLTERHAGRRWRRALVTLSFAFLFAPSVTAVGHGGIFPGPAWMVGMVYIQEDAWRGAVQWGLTPILATWAVFFVLATLGALMSKNKNNKVDTHGKEP
jgi:hypothetical protein